MAVLMGCALMPGPGGAETRTAFEAKRAEFLKSEAARTSDLVRAMLDGARFDEEVPARLNNQAEFTLDPGVYMRRVVSEDRVARARRLMNEKAALLERLETQYGVPGSVLVAIWGVESSFGGFLGGHDATSALLSLATTRRARFAEQQLNALFAMALNGDLPGPRLAASWAGAMGHTQFIPTSLRAYGVDENTDGTIDVWDQPGDALASTANYLSEAGWNTGETIAVEVIPPEGAAYPSAPRTWQAWAQAGWTLARDADTAAPSPDEDLRLLLPAGAQGPAFLSGENFRALLAYNRSELYALAITRLAQAAAGAPRATVTPWPEDGPRLSRTEVTALQEALAAKGFQPGEADGIVGPQTRSALRTWAQAQGMPADGFASRAAFRMLVDPPPAPSLRPESAP
jgi:lytic murein transglycosylase